MKTNLKPVTLHTHEGAPAYHVTPEHQLRRSIMSCLLWEKEFYEDGTDIGTRISRLVEQVDPGKVAEMAIQARDEMHLRHAPLLLVREMAKHPSPGLITKTLAHVIQRPDELAEFLSLYWKEGKRPLSAQVKKGLASAFQKFGEYQLAKYNRDAAITLRDVLFLCHAHPKDGGQAALWKRLVDGQLAVPDTWEVALSKGSDKKETFERMMQEGTLGGMALLRNLRNMEQAGVDPNLVRKALATMSVRNILPFRFIAAARYAPSLEPELEQAMMKTLDGAAKLPGHTVLLVDVSGSMEQALSAKSDMRRVDAACGVTMLARELCEQAEVFAFANRLFTLPVRRGFALRDAICRCVGGGTLLGAAVQYVNSRPWDRLIVVTDEQSHDRVPAPATGRRAYMINVASNQIGVGYGPWVHIDGWSESVVRFIEAFEKTFAM